MGGEDAMNPQPTGIYLIAVRLNTGYKLVAGVLGHDAEDVRQRMLRDIPHAAVVLVDVTPIPLQEGGAA